MALKGTLEDMTIINLIQFPHGGRKTGHLIISGADGEAKLCYENGLLVHAILGDASGMDALIRVVGWNAGTFEFVPDVEPEARSIDLDLHRAVMQALKMHDELKAEEQRRASMDSGQGETDEALAANLSAFLRSHDFASHASVLDSDGRVRASVDNVEGAQGGIDELCSTLHSLMQSYPRGAPNRVLIEDNLGTVALARLQHGGSLIVIASQAASLGVVSMNVSRLAAGLG